MKILLIKFMSIGDAVMSTVGFQMIREAFPKSWITALTLDSTAPIYEKSYFIDQLIIEPTDIFWSKRNILKILKRVLKWRKEKYDMAVSFHIGKIPNILTRLLDANIKIIPGEKNLKNLASLDKKSFAPGINHYIQAYPAIAREAIAALGGEFNIEVPRPKICFSIEEEDECKKFLAGYGLRKGEYISLFPGGGYNPGNQIEIKRYPQMCKAVSLFLEKNPKAIIILLGSITDMNINSQILKNCPSKNIIDLTAKTTLRQFANIIKNSALLVTNDSSALHIAQACDVKTIAIFGPTNPKEFVDPRSKVKVIAPTNAKPIYTGKYFGSSKEALKVFDEISYEYVAQVMDEAWSEENEDISN